MTRAAILSRLAWIFGTPESVTVFLTKHYGHHADPLRAYLTRHGIGDLMEGDES